MKVEKGIFKLYKTCYQFSVNLIVLNICATDLLEGENAKTPIRTPGVVPRIMGGKFVVKTSRGCSNYVPPDLKIEQTIHSSKKSTSGVVGQTRKENFVTEQETVYQEILVISNGIDNLTQLRIPRRKASSSRAVRKSSQ